MDEPWHDTHELIQAAMSILRAEEMTPELIRHFATEIHYCAALWSPSRVEGLDPTVTFEVTDSPPSPLVATAVYDVIRADLELDDARGDESEVRRVVADEAASVRNAAEMVVRAFPESRGFE